MFMLKLPIRRLFRQNLFLMMLLLMIIVGADSHDSDSNPGSAHMCDLVGNDWLLQTKLMPNDGAAGDCFGYSVAICNDLVVVGSCQNDSSGSIYTHKKVDDEQLLKTKLLPNDGKARDHFGESVIADSNIIILGALRYDDAGTNSRAVCICA